MKFITDSHLGKLAKYLRMLGFDTAHFEEGPDERLEQLAKAEERTILTRDRALAEKKGNNLLLLHYIETEKQLKEVLEHFYLKTHCKPFSRCLLCNGIVRELEDPTPIMDQIPPKVKEYNSRFWQCDGCGKIYWHGTHYKKMKKKIAGLCS